MQRLIQRMILSGLATLGIFVSSQAYAADSGSRPGRVLVMMPRVVSADSTHAWLASGLQESLADDLAGKLTAQISRSAQQPLDAEEAVKIAAGKANWAITTTVQLVESHLRITGQVLDVAGATPPVALKATGEISDLFELEDQISAEARRALAGQARVSAAAAPTSVPMSSGPLRLGVSQVAPGLEYALPYADGRFAEQANRHFFQTSCCGYGWGGWGYGCFGCCNFYCCGPWFGGRSAYPTVIYRAPF